MPLLYDKATKRWTRQEPLDPAIRYAAETPSGALFTIRDDGRVLIGDVELSDPDSLALHDKDPNSFRGYPVPHSGEGPCVVESNGYISAMWMGATPDIKFGTPIYNAVYGKDKGIVRYQMPFAGAILDGNAGSRRGIDNHCFPQILKREPDKRIVYVEGCHNSPFRVGVSSSPHATYGFQSLYPVGPQSRYTNNGHTYPAALMVGDTLHIVSRFLDGKYMLMHFTVDTLTMQTGEVTVLDEAPDGHKYAIWYQQPRVEGDVLIIETNRRWRPKDKPDTFLTDPEPKRYEVSIK